LFNQAISNLKQSEFFRHVGILATGTLVAQTISVSISPLLTRLYQPEDYAGFALFTAIAYSLAPGISGRYDLALVVTKEERDRGVLIALACWVSVVLCLLLAIGIMVFFEPFVRYLNAGVLGYWVLLAPLALLILANDTILRHYANSQKHYSIISKAAIIQATIVAGISLIFGLGGFRPDGLLIAVVTGSGLVFGYLVYSYKRVLVKVSWLDFSSLIVLAKRYKNYPLLNAPSSFLDGLLLSLPVFFLIKHFPEAIVGYYALLTRVAVAPLSFIGGAISQVHIKKIAEVIHEGASGIPYLHKITLLLLAIALIPVIFFTAIGPEFFEHVFGKDWRIAGELIVLLMPSIALRFVVSPLSGALLASGHLALGSLWQVIAFIASLTMFLLVAPTANVRGMIVSIMLTDLVLYSLYYIFIWYSVKSPKVRLVNSTN
jgi:O-antigen/teichoic acid export membrane protein